MSAFKDWLNGLTSKTTLTGTEQTYIEDGGVSKKTTIQNLMANITGALGTLGETVTASKPIMSLTQTWNNATVVFTGKLTSITNTASASGSLIEDWKVDTTSRVVMTRDGRISTSQGVNFCGGGSAGANQAPYAELGSPTNLGVGLGAVSPINWYGTNEISGSADLVLVRDAANTLAQRNGTSAQTFRLYNTYTDASNYERGFMRWASNVLEIGAEAAGTGTARNLWLRSANGTYITASSGTDSSNLTTGRSYFAATTSSAPVGVISAHENKANWKSDFVWSWAATAYNDTQDAGLIRAAAGVVGITGGATAGGAAQFVEMTAPAAPATNGVRIYAEDNGSGKTRLMALFATGAAVQIAIEP